MTLDEIKPGPDLYLQVRQGFVGQGSSLNRWCVENSVKRSNATACLKGMWNGPKGTAMRNRVVIAAGILDSSPCESVDQLKSDCPESTEAEEFFYWGC